jgi:hypothetical protein
MADTTVTNEVRLIDMINLAMTAAHNHAKKGDFVAASSVIKLVLLLRELEVTNAFSKHA